jgi:hypothetical protein
MAVTRYLDNTVLAERIQLAAGVIAGASFNHKFGATPAMSQNQSGSVWDVNDTNYPWTALDTPAVVNIERTNVADDGLNVTVQGLDSDYNYQEETITISGADTLGTKLFRRVNRAFCTDGGATNTGNINIEAGTAGGTVVARITAGKGQTLMAVYTVPKGKTAYIMQGTMTVAGNSDATGDLFVKYFGQDTFRVGHSFEVTGAGGQYLYPFSIPIRVPEKTDIDVRAAVRSNNARITAAFDMVLLDNKINL